MMFQYILFQRFYKLRLCIQFYASILNFVQSVKYILRSPPRLFLHVYVQFLTPYVKKTILSSLGCHCLCQKSVHYGDNESASGLCLLSLIYVSILLLILCCLDDCSFTVSFKIVSSLSKLLCLSQSLCLSLKHLKSDGCYLQKIVLDFY